MTTRAIESSRTAVAVAVLTAGLALAAESRAPRGTFALGKAALIRFVEIPEEKLVLGILVRAEAPPLKALLNHPVVELARRAGGDFRGQCDARLVAGAQRGDWLKVRRAAMSEAGSLRLDVALPSGGDLSLVLSPRRPTRVETTPEPGPEPTTPIPGLEGIWLAPSGDITRYVRQGQGVRGYVVRVAPGKKRFGFKPGEESVRLKQIGPGLYVGTVKARTADGRAWWEPVQIAVLNDKLTYTRHTRTGEVEKGTARRL